MVFIVLNFLLHLLHLFLIQQQQVLHRMLDARQLGLKLIANVTYGYTAANFSGRMPCIEVNKKLVNEDFHSHSNHVSIKISCVNSPYFQLHFACDSRTHLPF